MVKKYPSTQNGCMRYILVFLCVAGFIFTSWAKAPMQSLKSDFQLASTLEQALDANPEKDSWHQKNLYQFYKKRGFIPVWYSSDGSPKRHFLPFISALTQAVDEGLEANDYPFATLAAKRMVGASLPVLAGQELVLTDTIMHYMSDLYGGRVNPSRVFPLLFLLPKNIDLAPQMEQVLKLSPDDLPGFFSDLGPDHSDYTRLREALGQYRTFAQSGNWLPIPSGTAIKPGATDSRIPAIRQRLLRLGWIRGQNDPSSYLAKDTAYKPDMAEAIRQFQRYQGTEDDGIIGARTLQALNIPVGERIGQIKIAMESWRWLPENLGEKYVFVNIPGFYAKGVEDGKTMIRTPVIVGEVAHETPAFSSYITNVKFYPDWSVPDSIARRYVLEKIRNNPGAIDSLKYELYKHNDLVSWDELANLNGDNFPPYSFRQAPGPANALGLVRFSVDNDYSIYLHDTPDHTLFKKTIRTFSSGCIRVDKQAELAVFLLDGQSDLSREEIMEKFNVVAGQELKTQLVKLENPVPVHIVYMTAWVDEEGNVHFENDIYGRDRKLKQALTPTQPSL